MSHTPQQLADLARAVQQTYDKYQHGGHENQDRLAYETALCRYMDAVRDPAVILALCERLHDLADDVAQEGCFEVETLVNWCMTTPLTPKARAEEARP